MLRIGFLLIVLVLGNFVSTNDAEEILMSDLQESAGLRSGERGVRREIAIGTEVKVEVVVLENTNGTGSLQVANLDLQVIDEHDDGTVYQDGMPHIEFVDIDGDGFKDLVVAGNAIYTDDHDRVLKNEPFVFIYTYVRVRREFKLKYKFSTFKLEEGVRMRK